MGPSLATETGVDQCEFVFGDQRSVLIPLVEKGILHLIYSVVSRQWPLIMALAFLLLFHDFRLKSLHVNVHKSSGFPYRPWGIQVICYNCRVIVIQNISKFDPAYQRAMCVKYRN